MLVVLRCVCVEGEVGGNFFAQSKIIGETRYRAGNENDEID